MKLIITAKEDDWMLAIRAAKSFLQNGYTDCAIIAYENGVNFLVTLNKSSISVRQEETLLQQRLDQLKIESL